MRQGGATTMGHGGTDDLIDMGRKALKIGLITSIREDQFLQIENFLKRYMSNLAPLYLESFLRKRGLPVEVYIKDRLEDLAELKPDLLGISSVTENFEFAKTLAKRAKDLWNPITVLGGVHITAIPDCLPKEFDVGVIGEGEETFADIVSTILEKSELPDSRTLTGIPGIVFHEGAGLRQTSNRKGIAQLDEIPLIERQRYIKEICVAYMMTSRGCPYTCNFCVIPNISEGYRVHSPEYVLAEIKEIKRHFPEVKHIRIFDDLFIVNRRRVHEIAELIHAEGLDQEISFGCWGRGNLIDDALIEDFRKMNMLYVAFGAESGSSRVLSKIKPGTTLEQNQNAIDRLYDGGIHTSCSVILGHPQETEEDIWATYNFIAGNFNKLLEIEFNVALPWPGTELWRFAEQRGLVSRAMNFDRLKECAYFPNYSAELYPYLNEQITPERFEVIINDFKLLYKEMMRKMRAMNLQAKVGTPNPIAQLY